MTEITKLRNVCENNTKQVQIFLSTIQHRWKDIRIFVSFLHKTGILGFTTLDAVSQRILP